MRVTAQTKLATRRRILDAARKLFAQEGFEAATTRDIARQAQIATGTLFNYFPTKDSIVLCLAAEEHGKATAAFWQQPATASKGQRTAAASEGHRTAAGADACLEEELFAHVAAGLRRLKPYRRCLLAALEASRGSRASGPEGPEGSLREAHLETVGHIVARHGLHQALTPLAVQLYWTLYTGVLNHWAEDSSPKQEDTLALLDQSLAMFVGWLTSRDSADSPHQNGG